MTTPRFPIAEFLESGEPLAVVPTTEAEPSAAHARTLGWAVLLAASPDGSDVRTLQDGLATDLDLPHPAATNLDALQDIVRDLPDRAEDAAGTLLVWTPARGTGLEDDGLVTLLEVLGDAAANAGRRLAVLVVSDELARQLEEDDA
ncbi:barstar family protein [Kytococcus sp. Marseille-QA3725]